MAKKKKTRESSPSGWRGEGVRVRLRPIHGLTPKLLLPEPLRFPAIVGEDFSWETTGLHTEYRTIGRGEFSLGAAGGRENRQLRRLPPFTVLTSWTDYPFLSYRGGGKATNPKEVRDRLEAIADSNKPVWLIVTLAKKLPGGPKELKMMATCRSVGYRIPHGEVDTRYLSVEFVEYREAAIGRRKSSGGGGGRKSKGRGKKKSDLPTNHKLGQFDSFRDLAKDYYGSKNQWKVIAEANGMRNWDGSTAIVKSHRYKVGDKVKIPAAPSGGTQAPGKPRKKKK